MTDLELCDALQAAMPQLSAKDQEFALSLITSVRRYGSATQKQRFWLETLPTRANGGGERQKFAIGDMAGIMRLFDKARQHLKAPAVVLQGEGGEIRLSVAGEAARAPGTINVAENKGYGESKWFGRILLDGQFEVSPRETPPAWLTGLLSDFAESPARVAAEHGKLTGKCCFCNKALTDERSTAVGYGAKCSSNFGVPYPKLSEVRAGRSDLFAEAV
jgi:hypothetical protein